MLPRKRTKTFEEAFTVTVFKFKWALEIENEKRLSWESSIVF